MKDNKVTIDASEYNNLKAKEKELNKKIEYLQKELSERDFEYIKNIEGLEDGSKCIKIIYSPIFGSIKEIINCEELEDAIRDKVTEQEAINHPCFKDLEKKHLSLLLDFFSLKEKVNSHNNKWYNFNKIK